MRKLAPLDLWTIGILLIGIALRLYVYSSELWIDEIWSIMHVREGGSFWNILNMHHDNNHYLYSMYLWLIGERTSVLLIKLPALITGILLPFVMTWWARKQSSTMGLLVAIFTSMAFTPVAVTELGRGYAPMLLFGFLAYTTMLSVHDAPKVRTAVLYGLLMTLALLSHLTAIHLLIALGILSVYRFLTTDKTWHFFRHICIANLFPIYTLALLYFIDIRHMKIGGGFGMSGEETPILLLSSLFGLFELRIVSVLVAYSLLIFFTVYFEKLLRTDKRQCVCMVSILFIAPLAWLIICTPPIIYVRYFLICQLFALLFLAHALSYCKRTVSIVVAVLFCIGNIYALQDYLEHRYGNYMPSFEMISSNSSSEIPIISGNNEFIIPLLMYQYERDRGLDGSFVYVPQEEIQKRKPEWVLSYKAKYFEMPPTYITPELLEGYELQNADDPNIMWYVYRRIDGAVKGATKQELEDYVQKRNILLNTLAWYPYNAKR